MQDLTVENMFSEKSYRLATRVSGAVLGPVRQRRLLAHVVADATQKILSEPGANPVGLTVTVTLVPGLDGSAPDIEVVATCPQRELSESFFD